MKYREHEITVVSDKGALEEYNVEINEGEGRITCWIASESGQKFTIKWSNTSVLHYEIVCYPTVDGTSIQGLNHRSGQLFCTTFEGQLVSETLLKPFLFSSLETTDDDAYLHNSGVKDIGEIKLAVWEVTLAEQIPASYKEIPEELKVHERAKKAMAHRISYGEARTVNPTRTLRTTKVRKIVEFVFRYRSLDFLQAEGIAEPRPQSTGKKRKASRTNDSEEESEQEEGNQAQEEAELKELLAKVHTLQSKLAKSGKKGGSGSQKRVKTEAISVKVSGEIIDLTED